MNFVSNEYIAGSPLGNVGTGNWALYFRLKTTSINCRLLSKASGSTGWSIAIYSGGQLYFEDNGSTGSILPSIGAITGSVFKDCLFFWDSGTLFLYVDGILNNSVLWTPTFAIFNSSNLWVGRSSVGTTNFTGSINDVRLYNNITIARQNLATLLYEAKGADNITEGLVTRVALEYGTQGSTVGNTTNIGSAGGVMSVTNTPTFEALPFNT